MMSDPLTREQSGRQYVLMTAAHNEEDNIGRTVTSVASQTLLPKRWVIVDDGSIDRTGEIVHEYTKQIPFISLLSLPPGGERSFSRQAKAFQVATEALKDLEYDFIGTLDSDITLAPDYFDKLLTEFERNPQLGLAGGLVCEKQRGEFRPRSFDWIQHVAGAVQLFRRPCYEAVGGFVALPCGGHDSLAEVTARSLGWIVRSIPELAVYHHRETGAAIGCLRSRLRGGLEDYLLGYDPLFEIIKCVRRISEEPFCIGATLRLLGFLGGYFRGEKRQVPQNIIAFLRKEQKQRLKILALKSFIRR
jgi:biofilm PGA synthesis N-glycosyltransferase PgaC